MKARETLFAQLRKQGAWNSQAVADDVRRICLGVAYGARKAAVDAKVTFRKYSAGARLAGAWGYYAPSEVWLHAYTGRRRGCLVDAPEDSLDSYIYEYDDAGQLLRILFPARNVATYCLQNEAGCMLHIRDICTRRKRGWQARSCGKMMKRGAKRRCWP